MAIIFSLTRLLPQTNVPLQFIRQAAVSRQAAEEDLDDMPDIAAQQALVTHFKESGRRHSLSKNLNAEDEHDEGLLETDLFQQVLQSELGVERGSIAGIVVRCVRSRDLSLKSSHTSNFLPRLGGVTRTEKSTTKNFLSIIEEKPSRTSSRPLFGN